MKTETIYAKCLRVYNEETGTTISEEDFNLLREKFDIIRELYTDNNVGRDTFKSFRSIMKEVKRAAHNAGLKTEVFKGVYCRDDISIMTYNIEEEEVGINLVVTFKKVNPEISNNKFIITKFLGFPDVVTLNPNQTLSIIIDDDMMDINDLTYDFDGEEVC